MIKKLSINNFRCFKNFEVDILSKIVLISGKNNIGKTALLESLFFLFGHSMQDIFLRVNFLRNNQIYNFNPDTTWEHFFYNKELSNDIVINCCTENDNYILTISKDETYINKSPVILPQSQDTRIISEGYPLRFDFQSNNERRIGHFLPLQKGLSVSWEPQIFKNKLPIVKYVANDPNLIESLSILFGKIEKLGYKQLLLEILQTLEPDIENISTIAEEIPRVYAQKKNGPLLPLSIMGNGIVRLTNILCSLLEHSHGIILIDEIENGFHYSFYPLLWKSISELSKKIEAQIFITTHSFECITASSMERFDNSSFSYIRLGYDNHGHISPFTFSSEELEFAINNNIEVR